MATLPLDLDDVVSELTDAPPDPARDAQLATGTRIGHVHLQVSELERIESFYHDLLGFEVMVRGYPGALFVSAGGYHHHIGLNTWNSRGAGPPPPNAAGLHSFEVLLPTPETLRDVLDRVSAAGLPTEQHAEGTLVRDPSGNGVLLTC
jgi:catechol 2,3-dioxygenase